MKNSNTGRICLKIASVIMIIIAVPSILTNLVTLPMFLLGKGIFAEIGANQFVYRVDPLVNFVLAIAGLILGIKLLTKMDKRAWSWAVGFEVLFLLISEILGYLMAGGNFIKSWGFAGVAIFPAIILFFLLLGRISTEQEADKNKKNRQHILTLVLVAGLIGLIFPTIIYFGGSFIYGLKANSSCKNKAECTWHDPMDGNIYQNNTYHFQLFLTNSINKTEDQLGQNIFPSTMKNEVERFTFKNENDQLSSVIVKLLKKNNANLEDSTEQYKKDLIVSGVSDIKQTNNSDPIWERKTLVEYTVGNKSYADIIQINNDYVIILEMVAKSEGKVTAQQDDIKRISGWITVNN